MKELSREQEITRIERLIARKDDEFDKEQGKRVKRTFFVLSAVIYLMVFMNDGMNCVQEYLGWILVAPILAGLVMFVSFGVMYYIMNGAMKRAETIAELKGELYAIKFSKYNKE